MSKKSPKLYIKKCAYCGKRIVFSKGYKPICCSSCGRRSWSKPDTEIQLFELQRNYLETRDKQYLSEMYLLLKDYTESMIKKIVSGKFKYDEEFIKEKAHDAVNSMLQYYMEKENFEVQKSFGGYMQWKIKEVLYVDKEEDQHDSLNYKLENSDKESQDLIDLNNAQSPFLSTDNLDEEKSFRDNEDLLKRINNIIDSIVKVVKKNYGSYLAILVCIGIKIYIDNKNKTDRFYDHYSVAKKHIDNAMMLIFEFIKE